MKKQAAQLSLAALAVLAGMTLRRAFSALDEHTGWVSPSAAIGCSPVPQRPQQPAALLDAADASSVPLPAPGFGTSPVPLPPPGFGTSPVPLPPPNLVATKTSPVQSPLNFGTSPVPLPPPSFGTSPVPLPPPNWVAMETLLVPPPRPRVRTSPVPLSPPGSRRV